MSPHLRIHHFHFFFSNLLQVKTFKIQVGEPPKPEIVTKEKIVHQENVKSSAATLKPFSFY